jgi:hypothetical protein
MLEKVSSGTSTKGYQVHNLHVFCRRRGTQVSSSAKIPTYWHEGVGFIRARVDGHLTVLKPDRTTGSCGNDRSLGVHRLGMHKAIMSS